MLGDHAFKVVKPKNYDEKLQQAAENNNVQKLKISLSSGADVNSVIGGNTPLHRAVYFNKSDSHFDIIELLLKNGADVNAQVASGNTPLHLMAAKKDFTTVKLLLNYGADVNMNNKMDARPIMKAIEHNNSQIIKLLVDHGSELGDTLHLAMQNCTSKETIKYLLKQSENIDALNNLGLELFKKSVNTRSSYRFGSEEILKFVLKYSNANKVADLSEQLLQAMVHSEIFLEHIAKLKSLDLKVHPRIINAISSDEECSDYYQECINELFLATNTKLENSWVTYFNLLVDGKKKLKNYARNKNLVRDFKESECSNLFSIYKEQMIVNVMKGAKRRELFDRSLILFSDCLPIFNPTHLVVRDVLDYLLSTKDLSKFCG